MTACFARKFPALRLVALFVTILSVLAIFAGSAIAQNPVPFTSNPLVPDATAPGGTAFTLTVNGTGFVATSVVNWNGSPRATTFVSSAQLTATILASDIATASMASVTVVNPSPGGGVSNNQYFSTVVPGPSVSFLPAVAYTTFGITGEQVVAGDLRGNGIVDLVQADASAPGVGVLLGNGDGTFQPAVAYATAGEPTSLAIVDVNGDQIPDLVVGDNGAASSSTPNFVMVLLGNGDGTFQPAVAYDAGGWQTIGFGYLPIVVEDVNGDGKPDVVVVNECAIGNSACSEGAVGVLLGNGDGTFQPAQSYSSGGSLPGALAVTDLRGNGKPDLVVTGCATPPPSGFCPGAVTGTTPVNGVVGVLLGNGDGTFQPVDTYSSGSTVIAPGQVAVADLNGDGRPDLVVTSDEGGTAGVLLGNGDGTFQPAVTYGSGGSAASVAVGDVNGDGKPDLVVTNYCADGAKNCANGSIGVLLGNGDGTFQPVQDYATGTGAGDFSALLIDVNGDGILDAEVGGTLSESSEVLQGVGNGTFQPALDYSLGGLWPNTLVVADLNGDGKPDLVLANWCVGNPRDGCSAGVEVLLNNSGLHTPTTITLTSTPNPAGTRAEVTYSATVAGQSRWVTGAVTFYDADTAIATVQLANHQAAFSTSYKKNGGYSITASYSGDADNAGSSSSLLTQYIEHLPVSSETALATSGSPSLISQPVTFTATVTSAYGAIPNGELVTFYMGSTEIGTGTTASGIAMFATSSLTAKTHTIKATYAGDATFKTSYGTVTQVVDKYTTTTALSSNINPSNYGEAVTFTATVASLGPTPAGKVLFKNGTAPMGSAILSGGVAKLTRSNLAVGSNSITAEYLGDANSGESSSSVLDQVVQ